MPNPTTADALGMEFERVSTPLELVISSSTGVILMALGLGGLGVLTLRTEKATTGRVILGLVMIFAMYVASLPDEGVLIQRAEFAIMLGDFIHVIKSQPNVGNAAWLDLILVAAIYQCTSFIAYASQWFFGLRVYQLYPHKRFVCVPVFITAHVSLISSFVLCIKGYTQPRWNSSSSPQEIAEIATTYRTFLKVRGQMQIIWMCSSLVCDFLICALIVVALLRMKTFLDSTKGVIHRMAFMVSETMLPPMLVAALWTGVIASRAFGPGSWFRNLGPLQSLFYWFAILWSIRTRKSFLAMLNPPRPPPPTILGHGSPAMSIGFDLEPVSCTLVPQGSYIKDTKELIDSASAYSPEEQIQVLTIDEALKGPDRDEMV